MDRVQVSARIIRWPGNCACCCGPANTSIDVTSTRVRGKRVIRNDTKGWEVPYCKRCLAHVQAAANLHSHSMRVTHLSWVFGLLGALLAVLIAAPLLFVSVPLAIIVGVAVIGVTLLLLAVTFNWCNNKYNDEVDAKRAERDRLERELNVLLQPSCSEEDRLAAEYDGWHGSVHTFYFSNRQFVAAFEQANAGKVLG